MTGLSPQVGVVLVGIGALAMLLALVLLIRDRRRRARARFRASITDAELDELLSPKTTVLPVIPATPLTPPGRRPGGLFEPYDGPVTPEPSEHPGE